MRVRFPYVCYARTISVRFNRAFASIRFKCLYVSRTFILRVRLPYEFCARTISSRLQCAYDFRTFVVCVRFPYVFSLRTITVRINARTIYVGFCALLISQV